MTDSEKQTIGWTVETAGRAVDDELEHLPPAIRARFVRIAKLIAEFGLESVGGPHVRHLKDSLWEIRIQGKEGRFRALYVTASDKRVIVLRVFHKKTRKTPLKEIELALQRAKEALE